MPFTRPKPASALPAIPSRCPRPETIACFRYRFDSNQARQTVRWRRFRSLLFAPVFAAEPDCGLRALSNPETSALRQRGLRPAPPCTRQAPARHRRKPAAAHMPQTIAGFATVSIAAKPLKPCDSAVFRACSRFCSETRPQAANCGIRAAGFGLRDSGHGLQLRLQTSGPKTALPQPGLRHAFHTPKTRKRIASNPQPLPAP